MAIVGGIAVGRPGFASGCASNLCSYWDTSSPYIDWANGVGQCTGKVIENGIPGNCSDMRGMPYNEICSACYDTNTSLNPIEYALTCNSGAYDYSNLVWSHTISECQKSNGNPKLDMGLPEYWLIMSGDSNDVGQPWPWGSPYGPCLGLNCNCVVTENDACNYFYSGCNGNCSAVECEDCSSTGTNFSGFCCDNNIGGTSTDPFYDPVPGDVTGNGTVDIIDIQSVITWMLCGLDGDGIAHEYLNWGAWDYMGEDAECNIICHGNTCKDVQLAQIMTSELLANVDLNQDGIVNLIDVIGMVKIILDSGTATPAEIDKQLYRLGTSISSLEKIKIRQKK